MSKRMRVSGVFETTRVRVVDVLYRPKVVRTWIGEGARVIPLHGRTATLPAADGTMGFGTVIDVFDQEDRHVVRVKTFGAGGPVTSIRVTESAGGVRVRIEVSNLPDDESVRIHLQIWQEALNRLDHLLGPQINGRRGSRQALLVVHGVGEQLPGQTLRAFVKGVFGNASVGRWVKPDPISRSFEMRKIAIAGDASRGRPATDVYELYWANLVRDTTPAQVRSWLLGLLRTPLRKVPAGLRKHVVLGRIALGVFVVVAVLVGVAGALVSGVGVGIIGFVVALGGLVWAVVRGILRMLEKAYLVGFVGDAVRYFRPEPDNIAIRQAIREGGVDLLESLHSSGRYDRIVVFGHSLGSVIAYDILSFAWIRFGRRHRSPSSTHSTALAELERALPKPSDGARDVQRARVHQQAAWEEARANSLPWLVTDFVSAGSPLAHAEVLLTYDSDTSVEALTADRVFPCCPPVAEVENGPRGEARSVVSYQLPYRDVATGQSRSIRIPHHAALFAFTRWTNLYFPFSGLLHGDPVGGPLSGRFGSWIDDRPLDHPGAGWNGFAHTLYWDPSTPSTSHIEALRDALCLDRGPDLERVRGTVPFHEG